MQNINFIIAFGSPIHMLPANSPSDTTLSPLKSTSPKCPSRMCHTSVNKQSPCVGSWEKLHGQGSLQLQTSNQSPRRCQSLFVEVVIVFPFPIRPPWGIRLAE